MAQLPRKERPLLRRWSHNHYHVHSIKSHPQCFQYVELYLTYEIRPHKSGKPRTALILYGSETGNAQDVAEEIGRMAERLRFDTTVLDMDSVKLRDILTPTVVFFSISTTGQGEMPQNGRLFWKTLLSGALKPGVLRKVRFASFGLGDSSYARFNVAHRMLCGRLVQLGAQAFCKRGEGNEQHPEGHSGGFREWITNLRQSLSEVAPLADGLDPIANDVFLEPKWKLDLSGPANQQMLPVSARQKFGSESNLANGTYIATPNVMTNGDKVPARLVDETPPDSPSLTLLPVQRSHIAHVVSNDRVTALDHFQDVRLMDLRLEDAITYGPGAVAVVYPKNFPGDVLEFISLMGWQDIADRKLILKSSSGNTSDRNQTPSPLRHLNFSEITLTLRWLLENVLDIMSIPRRSFFASLVHFAGESTEDEAYQKERLLELANPELIDELWDYTTRPKRTILEAMMDFTAVKIPWQYALSTLPLMKGRQFSIASGGHLRKDEDGKTRVQLLVAIADPPSPIIKWRRRYGVCTRYIASLQAGQQISIGMQPGYLDVLPEELEVPVVMVGPGTGLAPMRSMIYQRRVWAEKHDARPPGQALKGDVLIFGCRNELGDYFFRKEWEDLQHDAGLTVFTAFSRDNDKPKQYVQDQIRMHGGAIKQAVVESNGKIYICGSSGNMPKGVRQALLDVLVQQDPVMSREQAESYLDRMEKNGRYKQETW